MIEKLNVAYIQVESDGNAKLELANKINELVDAVNKLQHDNSEKANCQGSVQDRFAEQRKWIGYFARVYYETLFERGHNRRTVKKA
jgi:hypothetical protein